MTRAIRAACIACGLTVLGPAAAFAQDRHAVLVFGATGGEKYAAEHARWAPAIESALQDRFGFAPDRIVVLSESGPPSLRSTRETVARTLTGVARTAADDDLVLIVLIGHGTADAASAKFNLPGPDLDEAEWAALLRPIRARVVFVNTAAGSFPFLQRLSAPNRIVITATDSAAQRFYTVFPDRLVSVLLDPSADRDKNGRVSVWEIFAATSAAVRQHYEGRGQLPTERPLLDDDADGRGSEADAAGPDGVLARTTYVDANPIVADPDSALGGLLARQRELERSAEEWKQRKGAVPQAEWDAEFERLMIELARVSKAIRSRS